MARFNTKAPLDRIKTILEGIDGVQEVAKGVPKGFTSKVCAFVTVSGQVPNDKAAQLLQREANYYVGICYRVADAVDDAEDTIADVIDELIDAIYDDRTLAGTVASARLDLSLANQPEYQDWSGKEYRTYPVMVMTTQRANL